MENITNDKTIGIKNSCLDKTANDKNNPNKKKLFFPRVNRNNEIEIKKKAI